MASRSEICANNVRGFPEGGDGYIARMNFPALTLKANIDEQWKVFEERSRISLPVFSHAYSSRLSVISPFMDFARKQPRGFHVLIRCLPQRVERCYLNVEVSC